MKNFGRFIFASILVLAAASCRKDTTEFIPTDTLTIIESDTTWDDNLLAKSNLSTNLLPPLSIEKLVNQLSAIPKLDSCNAERGGTIIVSDNVTITIPASACVNAQNRACTGKLDVEILILRKKGEFIAFNLPTSSGNKQLISGGVVYVKVRQNGQEVKLANNKTIKIRYLMTEPDAQMQLFEGKHEGRFNFDWVQLNGQGNARPSVTPWVDSSSSQRRGGYDVVLDRFGLINCAKFSDEPASFNNKLVVTLPEMFTNLNTSIYVAFKDLNSVLSLSGDSRAKAFVPIGRGLPVGKTVTIVVMGYVKEKFYFITKEITIPNTAQAILLRPAAAEKDDIKEMLKNL